MNYKKQMASVIGTAVLFSSVSLAAADSQPMVLDINPSGKALIRGTVETVGSNSLTLKSWGGPWVIRTSSTTKFAPDGIALSDIKVGDFVGVDGKVATGTSLTIDAKLIRDRSLRDDVKKEKKENREDIKDIKKDSHESGIGRIFSGVVTNVDSSSFTLKSNNNQTFSVNVASSTKLVGKFFLSLSALSNIQVNDKVWIWGTQASSTITAKIVFDKTR